MKTNILAVTAMAVSGVVGCAAQSTDTVDSSSNDVTNADIRGFEESIRTLNSLNVVEVSALGGIASETWNCYGSQIVTSIGLVCPDDLEAKMPRIKATNQKLASIAYAAQEIMHQNTPDGMAYETAADLEALKALNILQVDHFVLDEPEPSNCYVAWCEESDRVRAGKLHAIVEYAKHLP